MHLTNEGSSTGKVIPSGIEQDFFQLLRQVPTAIAIVFGANHVYAFANTAYQNTFNRPEDDLIGRSIKELWPELTRHGVFEMLDQVLTTGEPFVEKQYPVSFLFNNTVKTGYYDIVVKPVNIPGDIKRGIMIHVLEVTENVEAKGQLEKEVANRTYQLKRSNDDLQQFAHVASHDLKEPVRKIMTFVDMLKTMHMQDNAALYLSKVEKSAGRMKTMIDGVLLYSSLTASEQKIQAVDLNEVMQQISEELEVLIENKNAVLHWTSLPVIPGSFILLYQLFYNLVSNSLKFVKKDVPPQITVTHVAMDKNEWQPDTSLKYVKIMVSDNGIGFNQKDAEMIFASFTRLNSKDDFEGTGLGLTLCRKIVERHGGTMHATGEEGAGAVFTIALPY